MKDTYLVLDVGTTKVKAFIFDKDGNVLFKNSRKLAIFNPKSQFLEQDPEEIVAASIKLLKNIISLNTKNRLKSVGIATQTETVVVWNKNTGKPVYPAISWQDKRVKSQLKKYRSREGFIKSKTGLLLDPAFSALKIKWILDYKKDLRVSELLFGGVDSWLLWNICEKSPHVTDSINASRTMLFDIHTFSWSPTLLSLFKIPNSLLPKIQPSISHFGMLRKEIAGINLPINTVCGDQQASLYSSGLGKGITKITYGTGAFLMQVIGSFKTYADLITTFIPGQSDYMYAVEVSFGTPAEKYHRKKHNKKSLEVYLHHLAKETLRYISKLPFETKKLVIDGGITENAIVRKILKEHLPFIEHTSAHNTAFGVYKMLVSQN